jgi:hypothetical protein
VPRRVSLCEAIRGPRTLCQLRAVASTGRLSIYEAGDPSGVPAQEETERKSLLANIERAIEQVDRIQDAAAETAFGNMHVSDRDRQKAFRQLAFVSGFWFAMAVVHLEERRKGT